MKTTCDLCPMDCQIDEKEVGHCKVRGNVGGEIKLLTYGKVTTAIVGPIEQKPFYHIHPGATVLSIGSISCNWRCSYCQNFEISQVGNAPNKVMLPEEVIELALQKKCSGVAFTYSEPLIWYEYVMDVAIAAKSAGLKVYLKTNGYINETPFRKIMTLMDAVNIDIKGNWEAHLKVCEVDVSKDPTDWVMIKNLRQARELGKHVEVSHIAIPPYCDDLPEVEKVFSAIHQAAGGEIPLHVLKFIPDFKMRDIPPTTDDQLNKTFVLAKKFFRYVYIDYAGKPTSTLCDSCGVTLVKRNGILMEYNKLINDACYKCGKAHSFVSER